MAIIRLSLFILAITLITPFVFAQETTRYVRDVLYIVLRADQNTGSDIVRSGLTSGTPLKVIEESADGNYTLVETQDGERGWAQTQYLSDQPAARDLLEQAQLKIASLEEERDQMAVTLATLEGLSDSYNQQQQEMERMKNLSSNALQLDQQNTQLKDDNQALENELAVVTDENLQLKARMENSDFLYGAMAVLLGVIIAVVVPRLRPSRKSEWV